MINYLIIGCMAVLLFACVVMTFSRSMALARFGVLELVMAAAIGGSALLGCSAAGSRMSSQYLELFSVYVQAAYPYLDNLENTQPNQDEAKQQLRELLEQSLPVTTSGDVSRQYVNATVMRRDGAGVYQVWFSCGDTGTEWTRARTDAADMIRKSAESRQVEQKRLSRQYGLFALTDRSAISPSYGLCVEIPLDPLLAREAELYREFLLGSALLLVIGTLLLGSVILLQDRELRRVIRFTAGAVEGKEDWGLLAASGNIRSNEMRSLYNSLYQMSSDAARTSYVKYKALQAYCRFAPKEIEHILGRQSILDVQPDDCTHLCAALAFLSFSTNDQLSEDAYVRQISSGYKVLGEVWEHYGGVVLSAESDLTSLQILFREEMEKAVHFGLDVAARVNAANGSKIFLLLHKTPFLYGVAGDENQAFLYVHSRELKALRRHIQEIQSLRVRMVVTEYIYEAIGKEIHGRYIGFIEDGDFRFKFYEILDACQETERQSRIRLRERFEQALNLFYQGDFYLARNQFSEVLKECPTDDVAKRYLFLCESCLSGNGDNISYGLF